MTAYKRLCTVGIQNYSRISRICHATSEDELKDGADVVVNGATFNQMTGERIDRIWETLKKTLDFEFMASKERRSPTYSVVMSMPI